MNKKNKQNSALTEALERLHAAEEAELLSDNAEEHRFSDSFNKELTILLRKSTKKGGKTMRFKKIIAGFAAAALLITSTVCAYAMIPGLKDKINLLFLRQESIAPLTEVPEGYTGIYTTEDLDNIRGGMTGNYILMNDIEFSDEDYEEDGAFAGGFIPIGTSNYPFTGIFNGNGHVIYNLQVNTPNFTTAGLFGYVETNWDLYSYREKSEAENPNKVGYKVTATGGIIKNLGIEDSRICVNGTEYLTQYLPAGLENEQRYNGTTSGGIHVGAIAGYAEYIAGCYVKNTEVIVNSDSTRSVYLGGVAGQSCITDSCWSDADITFRAVGEKPSEENVSIAGVTGCSMTCVTSYFNGTVDTDGYRDYGVSHCNPTEPPMIINEPVMREILVRYFDTYSIAYDSDMTLDELEQIALNFNGDRTDSLFNICKLMTFYATVDYDEYRNYITYDDYLTTGEEFETVYLRDPETKPREREVLSQILAEFFPNNEFLQTCQENGVKYGFYGCYDLRDTPDADFADFDTDYIWYVGNGLPVLRLFMNHEKDTASAEKPRDDYSDYAEKMNQVIRK